MAKLNQVLADLTRIGKDLSVCTIFSMGDSSTRKNTNHTIRDAAKENWLGRGSPPKLPTDVKSGNITDWDILPLTSDH